MAGTSTSGSDLWASAQQGDPLARERLGRLAGEVAAVELARRRVERGFAEDLAQDVVRSTLAFVARGGEAPRDLPAFLKYRAWGVLSDHRKRMRTALPVVEAESLAEPAAAEPGPERVAHRRQLVSALQTCKEKLEGEQRVTLEMRYSSHLDAEEIARRLGVHRNTVHVRVFRALAHLRECLARKGFAPEDLEP
jgi:RNA polymerase sigma factor (sigma-70 family)